VREHSDDSREAVPLDGGGHQGRIAAVIKDGLRRSSREEEAARGDQRIVVY
jgi:hypothetical protein